MATGVKDPGQVVSQAPGLFLGGPLATPGPLPALRSAFYICTRVPKTREGVIFCGWWGEPLLFKRTEKRGTRQLVYQLEKLALLAF